MTDYIRVKDKDTGYHRTIPEHELPHGNYQVLKGDAVDPVTGDLVPDDYSHTQTSTVESSTTKKGDA